MTIKQILAAVAIFALTLPSVVMAKKSGKGSPARRTAKRNPSSAKIPASAKKMQKGADSSTAK